MTITLPIPDKKLWPNNTVGTMGQRMAKSTATRKARHHAYLATYEEIRKGRLSGMPSMKGYTLAFFYKDARRRDDDNAQASCKAYRDGIADALGVDDNTLRLAALPTFSIDRENPRVEITLI
jgi:crossover junction endodeoxyribonuclease RusA